ncbi:hypothetical protein [Catellatospora tritici]|uniref:hypothetical protein n=1 Tax=Catellatospora tritici TaxID=2851566 RepID=UPI001C2DD316|nr:hypothetical protein [Catellatospora tritici]MBV1848826.1 hypothetical protein [Catellatospora tritici]
MKAFTRRRAHRALSVAGLAAATLLAFSGFAQAEPEAAATIKACVHKKTGDVRIVELPKSGGTGCGKDERPTMWNVRGPRGPQGEPGEQGPPGATATPAAFAQTGSGSLPLASTAVVTIPDVPAGRYELTATVNALSLDGPAAFVCDLRAENTVGVILEIKSGLQVTGEHGSSGAATAGTVLPQASDIVLTCAGVGSYFAAVNAVAVSGPPTAP